MKIEYTNEAQEDLHNIKKYISVELSNAESAQKIVDKIVYRIYDLSDFPEIGAPFISCICGDFNYRYFVCENYCIFYHIEYQAVRVVRVLNARMNFMALLFGKDF